MQKGKMRMIAGKIRKRAAYIVAAAAFMLCMLCMEENTIVSRADMQITVTDDANVRSEASTSSSIVGKASNGSTLSAAGTVTGEDGMDWYQVTVNGNTGYIRSDLAEVSESSDGGDGEGSEEGSSEGFGEITSGTIISTENANVRSGPSSSDTPITTVKSGTVVPITGQATDSEGKTWYEVEVDGSTGYILSDLIDPIYGGGEAEGGDEPAEGEMPEDTEEGGMPSGGSEEVKQVLSSRVIPEGTDLKDMEGDSAALSEWALDNYYLLRTEDSSEGDETWYLYSTDNNKFEKVELVREGEGGSGSSLSSLMEGKGKIFIIIAVALFVILIIVCIVLAVKLGQYRDGGSVGPRVRNRYDDDDEDDDDEYEDEDDEYEDDEEDDDEYEDEDDEYEDDEEDDDEYEDEDDEYEDEEDDDEYEDERPVKKRRWAPKNFLSRRNDEEDDEEYDDDEYDDEEYDDEEYGDDDEDYMDDDDFEFEFLNMDDKDEY